MSKKPVQRNCASRPLVVGTGLLALDAVVSADESVPVRHWAGGTFGNVLIALRYLGWSAQPIARLADEDSTKLLVADLRRWKLSERFIRIEEDGSTPIIVHRITRDVDGQVAHSFSWRCTSCGARYPGYKPELLTVAEKIAPKLKNACVFFFDRVSAAALLLAKAAADSGALVAFEPSSVGNPIMFRQAWEVAHIVKYSHERLADFPDVDIETNPRLLIETLGNAGLRYRWRRSGEKLGTWVESKALPVDDVRDTAGSGDWCTAGLLSKLATKGYAGFSRATVQQIADAVRYGQALAAWNCRFEGARGGMYAISKRQFQRQIGEILAGDTKAFQLPNPSTNNPADAGVVCRVCEHLSSRRRTKRKAK